MKRILLFLAVAAMAMTSMAQEKVAILETVDKAGNIPYGIKLLLRSSLTTAISNTPGYEGYDRVDMASIAGEQEFQRTGNVSDTQIKQIGVAAGAKYVLVAEAAKYDDVRIIITAKLLDVETFGVKSSAVQITGTSADEMKRSCEQLAKDLIKQKTEAAPAQPQPEQEPVQTKKDKKKRVKYKRDTWFGISVYGGMDQYDKRNYNYTYDNYGYSYSEEVSSVDQTLFFTGLTADLQFPVFTWLSLGPYGGLHIIPYYDYVDIRFSAGAMEKITFNNDFGLMFGGGVVIQNGGDIIRPQVRLGIKFSSPVYMTFSAILYGWTEHDTENGYISEDFGPCFTIGIGYSFGGKRKVVEPSE